MFSAKLDVSLICRKLHATPKILHAEVQDKVLSEARLLVSSSGNVPGLVQVTPPFGGGKTGNAAKKQGEAKTEADIRKVYGTPSDLWRLIKDAAGKAVADNFWAYMKLQRWHQANEIALRVTGHGLDVFDGGTAHRARRDRNTGRVKGGGQPRDKQVFLAPTQLKAFESYIRKRKDNVGLLASSVPAAASSSLGKINGVPAWVSRHRGTWGKCEIRRTDTSLEVTVGLTSRAVGDLRRRFGYVLGYRVKAFKRQLPYIKRAALQRAKLQIS